MTKNLPNIIRDFAPRFFRSLFYANLIEKEASFLFRDEFAKNSLILLQFQWKILQIKIWRCRDANRSLKTQGHKVYA